MSGFRRIEINFPEAVELSDAQMQRLDAIVSELCDHWQKMHPGRVMWPAGVGCKITYMPMTRAEEEAGRHVEFDEDTFAIDCFERADYKWPCAKCAFTQADHKGHITQPPAADCEFAPKIAETAQ